MSSSPRTVHPRVCGELPASRRRRKVVIGSSPRVRGTHWRAASGVHHHRFIPACAGNSDYVCHDALPLAVHPRVCGELDVRVVRVCAALGSSPRVRGTPACRRRRRAHGRFIPACAGNSRRCSNNRRFSTVHPRVCGELSMLLVGNGYAVGSSPRVRGTPLGSPKGWPHQRFIPACAGNSRDGGAGGSGRAVHPRVCGELLQAPPAADIDDGSSPRVRGTRRSTRDQWEARSVHPRVCGELYGPNASARDLDGSSPRVRGTHSATSEATRSTSTVHPRVCGELQRLSRLASIESGSSPRVRGTRGAAARFAPRLRFIPACAGNSNPPR